MEIGFVTMPEEALLFPPHPTIRKVIINNRILMIFLTKRMKKENTVIPNILSKISYLITQVGRA